MLQVGNYDVLELSPPPHGMNQNISAYQLPLTYAYVLENILAKPLGEGTVRFGTQALKQDPLSPTLPPESRILGCFGYVTATGAEQLVLYVQEYQEDFSVDRETVTVEGDFVLSLATDQAERYQQDTPVKIVYQLNGINTVLDLIAQAETENDRVRLTLQQNNFPEPFTDIVFQSLSYATGTISVYDKQSGTLSPPLRQNLSVACVPRSVVFLSKLLLCNGVDRVMTWDGTTLADLSNFVKEQASSFNRLENTRFSFTATASFLLSKYAPGTLIQLVINGVSHSLTIVQAVQQATTVTVTTQTALPAFVANQMQLFYQDWPPRFSYLYVAHNRVWALGEGAVSLGMKAPDQALRVYYPYKSNSLNDWFHEQTKTVPSLDLTEQHGVPDTLEAISHVSGSMIFAGRVKTQIWTGTDPLQAGFNQDEASPQTLRYQAMVPTGLVHGDLLLELPNDLFFITKTGLQSLTTLNIAKQFIANSYDAVDPLIQEYLSQALSNNAAYRSCRSFKYEGGPWAGFKIGQNPILVSLFSTSLYAWSLFTGDFERASTFCSLNNRFYLACQNRLFQYGDGHEGENKSYGDQGGQALIPFSWSLPIVHLKGKRFLGLRYDLTVDLTSSFVLRPDNEMSLLISGDLPASYRLSSPCRFDRRGDALKTVPLTTVPDDLVTESSLGFRLDKQVVVFQDRFKFLASTFWLTLKGYTKDGPVSLKQLRLYGVIERPER